MSKFSFMKDTDRLIFEKLDDKDLLKACSIDKYTWKKVCDDDFFKRRMLAKYPEIEQYKTKRETWKQFYLRAIHYIALLEENFSYVYTFGNFSKQYEILKRFYNQKNSILLNSILNKELPLVIWSLKIGADIHYENDLPLRIASRSGFLEIVKYLIEAGADIHAENNAALKEATDRKRLEVVKYLKSKM